MHCESYRWHGCAVKDVDTIADHLHRRVYLRLVEVRKTPQ